MLENNQFFSAPLTFKQAISNIGEKSLSNKNSIKKSNFEVSFEESKSEIGSSSNEKEPELEIRKTIHSKKKSSGEKKESDVNDLIENY